MKVLPSPYVKRWCIVVDGDLMTEFSRDKGRVKKRFREMRKERPNADLRIEQTSMWRSR